MKKRIAAVLALTMLVMSLCACAGSGKKTFTVGFDASFPPYGYTDEKGEYVGFDLDLAAEVAKRNGWEVKYQPIDWDAKDMELSSGTIDCIWNGFTMSEERLNAYAWSQPYVDNSQVFAVKSDAGIASTADLAGRIVCTQADSSALEALQSEDCAELLASFSDLVIVPDYNTAFMNMEAGAVDAVALDIGVARYQVEARGGAYTILDEVLISEKYGVGFLKTNTALRDTVDKTLNEMAADGTFTQIAEKWDLTDSVLLGK